VRGSRTPLVDYAQPIATLKDTSITLQAARVGPLTVAASKKCLGVTFAPATAQFFEPVGREGLRRHWRQPALAPTSPRPVRYGIPASLLWRGCTPGCWGLTSPLWVEDRAQPGMQQPRSGIMQSLREFLLVTWRTWSGCYNAR
jgi:hypothetical protein